MGSAQSIFSLTLTLLSIFLTSCASPEFDRANHKKRSSTPPKKIKVVAPNSYQGKLVQLKDSHLGADAFLLILDRDLKFPGDSFVDQCRVRQLQVCPPKGVDLRDFLSGPVSITGELFGEHTAHHISPVLINTVTIRRDS